MSGSDPLEALREAARLSPENVPLRRHLAETLLAHGRADEAESEFRQALALKPEDTGLKHGLARAFVAQEKDSAALVVLEALVRHPECPGPAHVDLARLLLRRGDVPQAVAQYKLGLERDPRAEDADLAERLGIGRSEGDPEAEVVEGRVRAGLGSPGTYAPDRTERPRIGFADVGGMDALKEEIRLKIVHPLAHPELYRAYGKAIGGGILMYGPPGCGKTHLARATAGEIKAGFLAVGIDDVLDMWIGNSEKNMHALFEQARADAPCVLFFDEVDALGTRRADVQAGAGRHLVNQFLAEMDGVSSSNEGVLILAATNSPWHLDAAFRRPGRFDRILFVPPPDAPARAAILRLLCRGKPIEEIDYDRLAARTEGFSGADLKAVVDLAVEAKLAQAFASGVPVPLATKDLFAAADRAKPTTREWFATARNHALYSNQGGVYDDVLRYLKIT